MERITIDVERVPRGVCDDLARCLLERVEQKRQETITMIFPSKYLRADAKGL